MNNRTYLNQIDERMHLPANSKRLEAINATSRHKNTDDNLICYHIKRIRRSYDEYEKLKKHRADNEAKIELYENSIHAAFREVMRLLDLCGWE